MDTKTRLFHLIDTQFPSYAAFEKELGLSPRTLNNWKMGKSTSYLKMLPTLAKALQTTTAYLLCEVDDALSHCQVSTPKQQLGEFASYPDYEIPPALGKFLAQKLEKASTNKVQDFISHLEATPLSKVEDWKLGKGVMNNFEYWRFHSHFGGLRGTFHKAGTIGGVDKSVVFPENIYDIEGIMKPTKSMSVLTLKNLLAKELAVDDISDDALEKILEYAKFVLRG